MKKPPISPAPRHATPESVTNPRDRHRYHAEHPSRRRTLIRARLQAAVVFALLALLVLGLFAAF